MGISAVGNILANLLGRAWSSCLQFALIPLIARLLGPENFGLIGFYTTLLMTLIFLNQGMSSALVRELGRLGNKPETAEETRDLFHSLERPVLLLGLLIGGSVVLAAPLIARHWLHAGALDEDRVILSLRLMGLCLSCQWPNGLYTGGYVGLHRQNELTRLTILQTTLLFGGAPLLLTALTARPEVYFLWHAVTWAGFNLLARARLLRLFAPAARPGRFRLERLQAVWRFGAGSMIIGLTASLLTQLDNLMVSRFVPLDQFAAYSLSFSVASLITVLVMGPVSSVFLPLLAGLQAAADRERLAGEYHRWTQVTVFLALPMGGALIVFTRPLLTVWLGAESPLLPLMLPILPWIALGTLLNTVAMAPAILQAASGWTRLSIVKNFIALPPFLLILAWGIPEIGMIVGAWCWVALNLGYYLFEVPLTHRRLLPEEMWRWWGRDTLLPGAVATAVFALAAALTPAGLPPWQGVALACLTALVAAAALLAVLPHPRAMILAGLARLKSGGGHG